MNWPDDLDEINDLLLKDAILLLPTDSVWGICCDATSQVAIHRILKLKSQPEHKGLVTLVADIEMLKSFVPVIHPRLETLLSLHKRPMTVLYNGVKDLPDILFGEDGSLAVRVAHDPFIQDVIYRLGKPIVATLPAEWGGQAPSTFGAISSLFIEHVDYVAQWRRRDKEDREVSTIVRMNKHLELDFIRC